MNLYTGLDRVIPKILAAGEPQTALGFADDYVTQKEMRRIARIARIRVLVFFVMFVLGWSILIFKVLKVVA